MEDGMVSEEDQVEEVEMEVLEASEMMDSEIEVLVEEESAALEDVEDKLLAIIVLIVALQAHAHKLVKVFP